MKLGIPVLFVIFVFGALGTIAQNPIYTQSQDPMANISAELTNISRSVQTLNERLKAFVDKFEKVGGLTLTEKQQKLVLGLEVLVRAEQRVSTFQKFQIELVEKQNEARSKLAQVEVDLRPRSIDRSVAFEGTTETEELRDSKRQKLQAERSSLQQLLSQIQGNLSETNDNLREAQALANRLRRTFLPQIERELAEQ